MALTSTQTVVQLVVGMFGGAPGKNLLDSLVSQYNTMGQTQLAIELGKSPVFKSLYPTTLGGHAFANAYLSALVPGFDSANPAHLAAMNWMADRFDHGIPAGQVVMEAVLAVMNVPASDATWGATVTRMNDWITLATHYSVELGMSSTSVAELQDVFHAPTFLSADVNGATLTLHYSDLNGLDSAHAPVAGAFSVMVGAFARTVSAVSVDPHADTVTLTLASTVFHGEAVTVAYADPTVANDANAIQDVVGNDAASLAVTAVTNNTPVLPDEAKPVFAAGVVDGTFLTMTYTDASPLDALNLPAPGDFTVEADDVAVPVLEVQVRPDLKQIVLVLGSAVTDQQEVTVAYDDPSTSDDVNAIQDTAGHDAATLPATAVTNHSPDTSAPTFESAVVTGSSLVMSYSDTSMLDASLPPNTTTFSVMVDGSPDTVTAVAVDADAKTVTLTLATAASTAQEVTVAYTDPTGGDDSRAIQDELGNDAESLTDTVVMNNSPDAVAPELVSAAVDGLWLVLSYSDISPLNASSGSAPLTTAFTVKVGGVTDTVAGVVADDDAKTVTLTLTTAVKAGQGVTVAYTDATKGDDTRAIQDALGNDAASFTAMAATNNTGVADTAGPVLSGATVNGKNVVMSYIDSSLLDAAHAPTTGTFAVTVDGDADLVKTVVVDAASRTVTLTLATAVENGQVVTLSYTDPTGGNDTNAIQDALGNDASSVAPDVVNVTLGAEVALTGLAMLGFHDLP
ncbi:MAG TPA: SwmB domain-containing protein [Ramlibacter sp.]|nr:SwmB domain-containing protein [Ramlibacter sp.]